MGEQLPWCFQKVDIQLDKLAIELYQFHENRHLFDIEKRHSQFLHFLSHQRAAYSYLMDDCRLLAPNRHPMMESGYSNCCLLKLLSFVLSLLLLKLLLDWLYENELWNLSNFWTNQTFDWIANQKRLYWPMKMAKTQILKTDWKSAKEWVRCICADSIAQNKCLSLALTNILSEPRIWFEPNSWSYEFPQISVVWFVEKITSSR